MLSGNSNLLENKTKGQTQKNKVYRQQPDRPQRPDTEEHNAKVGKIQKDLDQKLKEVQRLKISSRESRQNQASSQTYAISSKIRQIQAQANGLKKQKDTLQQQLKEAKKLQSQPQKPSTSADLQKFSIKIPDIDQMIQHNQQKLKSQNITSSERSQVEIETKRLEDSKQKLQETTLSMSQLQQDESKAGNLIKGIQDKIANCDQKIQDLVKQEQHFIDQFSQLKIKNEEENNKNQAIQEDINNINKDIDYLQKQKSEALESNSQNWLQWETDNKAYREKQEKEYNEREQKRQQRQQEWNSRQEVRVQAREGKQKESDKFQALEHYDRKVKSCKSLMGHLQDQIVPEQQKLGQNNQAQITHDFGEGYSLVQNQKEKANDDFDFKITSQKSKNKGKNAPRNSKGKGKTPADPDKLNHSFDMILEFESLGVKLPQNKNEIELTLSELKSKLKSFEETIQKAENGEMDIEIPKDDLLSTQETTKDKESQKVNGSSSTKIEDFPTLKEKEVQHAAMQIEKIDQEPSNQSDSNMHDLYHGGQNKNKVDLEDNSMANEANNIKQEQSKNNEDNHLNSPLLQQEVNNAIKQVGKKVKNEDSSEKQGVQASEVVQEQTENMERSKEENHEVDNNEKPNPLNDSYKENGPYQDQVQQQSAAKYLQAIDLVKEEKHDHDMRVLQDKLLQQDRKAQESVEDNVNGDVKAEALKVNNGVEHNIALKDQQGLVQQNDVNESHLQVSDNAQQDEEQQKWVQQVFSKLREFEVPVKKTNGTQILGNRKNEQYDTQDDVAKVSDVIEDNHQNGKQKQLEDQENPDLLQHQQYENQRAIQSIIN